MQATSDEIRTPLNGIPGMQPLTEATALASGDYDLILMDVQMPEVAGVETTHEIRRRERTRGTPLPVLALTSHAMQGDRELRLESGMDGYLAEPLQVREVADAIARLVTQPASVNEPAS